MNEWQQEKEEKTEMLTHNLGTTYTGSIVYYYVSKIKENLEKVFFLEGGKGVVNL